MSDAQCETCQTSNGLNSTDIRSIIIVVVFVTVALISSYVGILWYAYRTRSIPEKNLSAVTNHNEAFRGDEEDYDDYIQPINAPRRSRTLSTQRVHFAEENEK
jgi:hypothetical protein